MKRTAIQPDPEWGVIVKGPIRDALIGYRKFSGLRAAATPHAVEINGRVHMDVRMSQDELVAWVKDRTFGPDGLIERGGVIFFVRHGDEPKNPCSFDSLDDLYDRAVLDRFDSEGIRLRHLSESYPPANTE